jgi:hypothetical protein
MAHPPLSGGYCSSQKKSDEGRVLSSGEARLKAAIERCSERGNPRSEDPRPYDPAWGWWIEDRIARLEQGQTWLIRIAIGALAAEIVRIVMVTTGLGS